jgi:hypothetical protein
MTGTSATTGASIISISPFFKGVLEDEMLIAGSISSS